MYKLIELNISFCDSKIFFLTITFICLLLKVSGQNKELKIEIDHSSYNNESKSIANYLEEEMNMNINIYVYNSINTKSMVGLGFSVDSLFRINSIFSENMPPLLKNEVITIFKRWTELKSMKDDVEENRIITNKIYVIPIIFHFRYTSDDESIHTFKRDYVSLDKFLKSMNWENTEMMDFIMIDLRNRKR